MSTIVVEITDFVAAARELTDDVGEPVRVAMARLYSELAGCTGMAGDDPGGLAWAASYDRAARATYGATHVAMAAAYSTSSLFGRSAENYARAEAASTAGGRGDGAVPGLPTPVRIGAPMTCPGSGGAGGDTPPGWWLVEHTVGYLWPNGHQDALHRAAAAWDASAAALERAGSTVAVPAFRFVGHRLPEADAIVSVCRGLNRQFADLAHAHRRLGRACTDLATHLDECHSAVIGELQELLAWSAGIQVAGAVLSIVTLGAAEVPTQAAQASRIAATAARIGLLIRRFVAAARVVGEAFPTLEAAARSIRISLEGVAGAKLAYAGMATARDLPRATRIVESSVAGAKGVEAGSAGVRSAGAAATRAAETPRVLPPRVAGRQPGDPGVWGDPRTLARHFRDHAADFGSRTPDDYVRDASDFLQRAYREHLPLRLDLPRETIRVWDPKTRTFGAYQLDGSTRTYYVADRANYFDDQDGILQ